MGKIQNKFKLLHPILVFKVLKDPEKRTVKENHKKSIITMIFMAKRSVCVRLSF